MHSTWQPAKLSMTAVVRIGACAQLSAYIQLMKYYALTTCVTQHASIYMNTTRGSFVHIHAWQNSARERLHSTTQLPLPLSMASRHVVKTKAWSMYKSVVACIYTICTWTRRGNLTCTNVTDVVGER